MVQANVDRIIDFLRNKKSASLSELSTVLRLPKEDIQKSAEYLEEDGVVKIDFKLATPYITLVKDPEAIQEVKAPVNKPDEQPQHTYSAGNLPKVDLPPPPPLNLTSMPSDTSFMPPAPPPHPGTGQDANVNTYNVASMNVNMVPQPAQTFNHQGEKAISQDSYQPEQFHPQPQMQYPDTAQKQNDAGKSNNKYAFLIDDEKNSNTFTSTNYQGSGSTPSPFMEPPVDKINLGRADFPDTNPLDTSRPNFDLAAPAPDIKDDKVKVRPPLEYGGEYGIAPETEYPKYAETNVDKIEYLVDKINEKIVNHDFKDLNVLYRKVYNQYKESEDLSPNERYLLAEKINSIFERIKRTYLIENVM